MDESVHRRSNRPAEFVHRPARRSESHRHSPHTPPLAHALLYLLLAGSSANQRDHLFSENGMNRETGHVIPPYGVAIHQAISEGDLTKMKALLSQAEAVLQQHGDLAAAVGKLKQEIVKREQA